jgi:ABC-type sugar transport system permease subunit
MIKPVLYSGTHPFAVFVVYPFPKASSSFTRLERIFPKFQKYRIQKLFAAAHGSEVHTAFMNTIVYGFGKHSSQNVLGIFLAFY